MDASRSVLAKLGTAIRRFLRNVRGVILIEFAVGMPLLLLLLFGMHDIFKMAQMQDKTNFAAHLVVQMLQNVSQMRKDKKLTEADLAGIGRLVSYVIYPGITMYPTANYKHVYAHTIYIGINYIRGESDGKATAVWRLFYWPIYPARVTTCRMMKNKTTFYASYFNSNGYINVDPSKIWPKLRISEGEVKIIVEVFIMIYKGGTYPDGSSPTSVKQLFGLHLLTPQVKGNSTYSGCFHSLVIFTPRRGIFDEEGPNVTYLE